MKQSDKLTILAVETSCDDTCAAVVEIKTQKGQKKPFFKILSNIVSSQTEIHKKWGGVYPTMAKREHQKNLPLVLKKALKKAKKSLLVCRGKQAGVNLIALTAGPGLEPCLWTGINFTKNIARKINVPIIPVNHIESHILVNFINSKNQDKNFSENFPAVCLIASGGHTQLILMKNIGKYRIIGETRDDAAGECFDKTARILGLEYPGGPALAALAAKAEKTTEASNKEKIKAKKEKSPPVKIKSFLPRPMINQKNYDFSFSGLKTAVLYSKENFGRKELAKEIQQAIIDVLIKKTIKAAKNFKAKTIILGGGVTANAELKKQFRRRIKKINSKIKLLAPLKRFCSDNAVMTAAAGYFNLGKKTKNWNKIKAKANWRI